MTDDFEYFYDLVALAENSELSNIMSEKKNAEDSKNVQDSEQKDAKNRCANADGTQGVAESSSGITSERMTYLINELQTIVAWSAKDNPFKFSVENTIKYIMQLQEEI